MPEDKYQKLAEEIKALFEQEFGGFTFEDFDRVIKIIKADFFRIKSDYKETYENLSPELREQIDFMMKL
ncbi:MAG: hypothetical protein U9P70_00795 [Patescibacteria group bacterium]|nr:hypothetical protein [Patescibacteria group bacterium]